MRGEGTYSIWWHSRWAWMGLGQAELSVARAKTKCGRRLSGEACECSRDRTSPRQRAGVVGNARVLVIPVLVGLGTAGAVFLLRDVHAGCCSQLHLSADWIDNPRQRRKYVMAADTGANGALVQCGARRNGPCLARGQTAWLRCQEIPRGAAATRAKRRGCTSRGTNRGAATAGGAGGAAGGALVSRKGACRVRGQDRFCGYRRIGRVRHAAPFGNA